MLIIEKISKKVANVFHANESRFIAMFFNYNKWLRSNIKAIKNCLRKFGQARNYDKYKYAISSTNRVRVKCGHVDHHLDLGFEGKREKYGYCVDCTLGRDG